MRTSQEMLDAAVEYVTRDWAPFPLQVGGKQPLKGSRGFYAGTHSIVQVRQWWRTTPYNIGLWTGESNLVVIDLDIDKEDAASWTRGGPQPGISWWLEMCEVAGYDWEQTYCVVTASGGMHVYFTSEKPYPPAVGKFGALVDIRAGLSYVVAAGSETDVGMFEHVCGDQVQPLPDWLDVLIDPIPVKPVSAMDQLVHDTRNTFEASLEGICRVFRNSMITQRNNTLNWCAWKVGHHFWTEEQKEYALERLRLISQELGVDDDKPGQTESTIRAQRAKWPAR